MRASHRLFGALTLLTWMLGWAARPCLVAAAAHRSEGSQSMATGKVMGMVLLAGTYEKPARLKVFKSRNFCGPWVPNETLLVNSEGAVQNAVIILHPLAHPAKARPASIVLDNRKCAFSPHVQVAPVDSELRLKNSDPILHTVHARLGQETLFNVALPRWKQVTKSLTRSGIIRIDCDVLHTWMSAAIVVTASPFHAVTDARGRFAIEQLPAGEYEMEAWHEKLGARNRRLAISAGAEATVDVVYGPNQKMP